MHEAHFADSACHRTVAVTENVRLARDTYRVRFECPELAERVVPGQFLMLKLHGANDPLLGRPLALYDTVVDGSGRPIGVDVVYLVVGKFTSRLAQLGPGAKLDVWGPLGNGFAPATAEHLIMVAGGIGQTPFMALAREYTGGRRYGASRTPPPRAHVTLCYGARSQEYLAGVDDFRALGIDVRLSTDDGSAGRRGFVTDVLRETLGESYVPKNQTKIVCCGPEKMMEAVAHVAHEHQIACEVSLETPMACGIGICFSCVVKVKDESGEWDYRRTCVEGPVFAAEQIVWD
ncbi:MAG: dihydroorotate dehydrogenase electron transfer subunit [Planctomycetaceae bacterium]|nr:dihydroorotate dehydrogenase electron transfer subunit [Planctomycetaceae bacterium]